MEPALSQPFRQGEDRAVDRWSNGAGDAVVDGGQNFLPAVLVLAMDFQAGPRGPFRRIFNAGRLEPFGLEN